MSGLLPVRAALRQGAAPLQPGISSQRFFRNDSCSTKSSAQAVYSRLAQPIAFLHRPSASLSRTGLLRRFLASVSCIASRSAFARHLHRPCSLTQARLLVCLACIRDATYWQPGLHGSRPAHPSNPPAKGRRRRCRCANCQNSGLMLLPAQPAKDLCPKHRTCTAPRDKFFFS